MSAEAPAGPYREPNPGYPEHPLVWFTGIDGRTFWAEVVRVEGERGAQLRVYDVRGDEPVLLLDEHVTLMADAIFGPDVSDVGVWQDMTIPVVDARLESHPTA